MKRNRILGAALFALLTTLAPALAKPPDLPLDIKVECQEIDGEAEPLVGDSDAEESSLVEEQCCPCLDTCCAGVCHWLIQALGNVCSEIREENSEEVQEQPGAADDRDLDELLHKSQLLRQQSQEPCSCPYGGSEVRQENLADELYRIAERCQKSGDHAMARSCYEEVQRMTPNTQLARRASQRLESCRESLSSQEEAEAGTSTNSSGTSTWLSNLGLPWPVEIDLQYTWNSAEARARITLGGMSLEFRSSKPARD